MQSPQGNPQQAPNTQGVLGDGALQAGKYNMAIARRAIRNDWPISEEVRKLVADQMASIIGNGRTERDRIAAAKVLVAADSVNQRREAMDQADEHHQDGDLVVHQGRIEHVGVRVIEDVEWYDNDAHDRPAQGAGPSAEGLAITGPVQGSDVRAKVGQNGHGTNGNGQGPRT